MGSPPPMRGKDTVYVGTSWYIRITPAYAGKSRFSPYRRRRTEDHPRLCGEKSNFNVSYQCTVGSPPPMRGKVCLEVCKP